MGLLSKAALALALGRSLAGEASVEPRQDTTSTTKHCDSTQTTVCYSQFAAGSVLYRIALPDVAKAPFDTLVQIVAPASVGWAGLAWGGSMSQNPLSVVWMNGNKGVASARWASGHTPPASYDSATLSVLGSSKNATHWQIDMLCTGCSTWSSTNLDPNAPNKLGFAMSTTPPGTPASNASTISIHTEKGVVNPDLSLGKVDSNAFRRFVLYLSSKTPSNTGAGGGDEDDDAPAAPPRPTMGGNIPTTVIRGSPAPTDEGQEPEETTSRPRATTTRSIISYEPTTIGASGPERTTIRAGPQPGGDSTSRMATVTVTVTRGGGVTSRPTAVTSRPTAATTSCVRRGGRFRRCYTTTAYPWGGDDQDDDQDGGGYGGGWDDGQDQDDEGWGFGWGRRDLAADIV